MIRKENMTLEYDLTGEHHQIDDVKDFRKIGNKYVYGIQTESSNPDENYLGEINLCFLPDEITNFHIW